MAITNAPVISQPVLADKVIYEMQTTLKANLSWLDAAFGRAQKITRVIDGKRYTLPNVFCGGLENKGANDYIELSPDSKIGNFCFFEVSDPQTIEWRNGEQMKVITPFSLIFWFDLRRVFNSATNRNTETLKNDILKLLNGRTGWHLIDGGKIEITKCYEDAKNVYRGYNLDEIDNQYLMHPFAGFRFEGNITKDQPCETLTAAFKIFDTHDATASASDIASGKTAYGADGKLTGTGIIASLQEKAVTVTQNGTIEVEPDASHNGLSKVAITTAVPSGTEEKTIEPSTVQQEYTPESPNIGFSKVIAKAVTSAIDANIQASNIKDGVTILGVEGTLEEAKPEEEFLATPTTSEQTITPIEGYVFSSGVIAAVTAAIDANIIAANIRKGVTILGVTGTLEETVSVNWNQVFEAMATWKFQSYAAAKFTSVLNEGVDTNSAIVSGQYSLTTGYCSQEIKRVTIGHKYITIMQIQASSAMTYETSLSNPVNGIAHIELIGGSWQAIKFMSDIQTVSYARNIYGMPVSAVSAGDTIQIKNINVFDLTQMFGSGNEPSTVAEFEAWLVENGINPDEYIPYNAGTPTRMTKPSWI